MPKSKKKKKKKHLAVASDILKKILADLILSKQLKYYEIYKEVEEREITSDIFFLNKYLEIIY